MAAELRIPCSVVAEEPLFEMSSNLRECTHSHPPPPPCVFLSQRDWTVNQYWLALVLHRSLLHRLQLVLQRADLPTYSVYS